jgi:hypothetical protein
LNVPGFFSLQAHPKHGMVLGLIEIDQLPRDGHQGQEKSEDGLVVAGKIGENPALGLFARHQTLRTVRLRTVTVHIACLPWAFFERQQKIIALSVKQSQRPIVAQR